MDGAYNIDIPTGAAAGVDCLQTGCINSDVINQQTIWKEKHWQLAGPGIIPGASYRVDLHLYGVVECKTYSGGTGPAKTDPSTTPNITQAHSLWINGGRDNGDHWNTYAFTVSSGSNSGVLGIGTMQGSAPDALHTWFFNQCPGSATEFHYTWRLDNTYSITVPAGYFINHVAYDSNCSMINNCGKEDGVLVCPTDYTLTNRVDCSAAVPGPPATLLLSAQPPRNSSDARGEWWFLDVTGVFPQ